MYEVFMFSPERRIGVAAVSNRVRRPESAEGAEVMAGIKRVRAGFAISPFR